MFKQLVTVCDSTGMTNFIVAGKKSYLKTDWLILILHFINSKISYVQEEEIIPSCSWYHYE